MDVVHRALHDLGMSEDDRWVEAGAWPPAYRKWWFTRVRIRLTVCRRRGHDWLDGRCADCDAVAR